MQSNLAMLAYHIGSLVSLPRQQYKLLNMQCYSFFCKIQLFRKTNRTRLWELTDPVSHKTSCVGFKMMSATRLFRFHTIATTFNF